MCETVTYLNSQATPIILLYQPHVGIHRIRKLQGLYFFERLLYPCLLIPRFTFYLVFVYSVPLVIFEVSFLLESYLRLLIFSGNSTCIAPPEWKRAAAIMGWTFWSGMSAKFGRIRGAQILKCNFTLCAARKVSPNGWAASRGDCSGCLLRRHRKLENKDMCFH